MSKKLFNDNWKFKLTEVGSEYSDVSDDNGWHDVEIPHDWLIGDTHNLYKSGDGWYRKYFDISKLSDNDVYILRFDGVYMDSTIYVNGIEAGGRKYGYSCFSTDITEYIKEGRNEIAVRVRYQSPNSRWYSGAGIYRNVYLRVTDRHHIAENGVYISSKLSGTKWLVTVETNASDGLFIIRHTVFDEKNNKIATIYAKSESGFSKIQFFAANPKLWDTENPELYTMTSDVIVDGKIKDTVHNTFGFRTTEFNAEKGFLLNGKQLKLKGVCMHHDLGALGAATNVHALKRQLKILKSYGVNAVRTSHNMPAEELIQLCNKMGLLVDSECFDMWELSKTEFDYARFFPEHYEEDVESWVTRDRNAPCVIMWSIGNEIPDTHQSERGLEVAKMLSEAVHKFDKYENAKCTVASNYMRWGNAQNVADFVKLSGYNYAEDLYDEHHKNHSDWFIYGSETASTVRSRGIYHLPADTPILTHIDMQCSDMGNSVVGWGKSHEKAIIDDRDRSYCGGQFVWTGFDYIGEPTPYSTKNSYFGIVDTAGFPKDAYYLYMSAWAGEKTEPFVHLLPYWDFNIGEEIPVFAYTNAHSVELIFNGQKLGRQHIDFEHGDKLHCEWKVPYRRGTIIANAYNKNGSLIASETINTFGDPVSIDASPSKYIVNADGRDLIFIEINALDKKGIPVGNARNRVQVTVEGAGRLVGLDNGDSTDYDSYKGDNRRLFSGKLLAIVQSTLEPGEITVSIKSKGLWGKNLTFTSLECEKPEGISVASEYYPFVSDEYKEEIPIRKIELYSTRNTLEPDSPTAGITAKILPENADYNDIEFRCVLPSGVEIGLADIERTEYGAKVTAKGDGEYILRAFSKNGTDIPQIISDINMRNKNFGSLVTNPYSFVSASLYGFSNIPLNVVERGAISGITSRSVIGFKDVDFGDVGTEKLMLSCGHCGGSSPINIELWLGDPDNGGRKLDDLKFENNSLWDRFAPQEFVLPERIRGLQSLAFVVSTHIIFGGFEFVPVNKAFDKLTPIQSDELYGDDYRKEDTRVVEIGNNVLINFNGLDFGDGTIGITICGRTPNDVNPIQVRFTGSDGVQRTQIIEFAHSDEYTEQHFELEKVSSKNNVSFVFMPGSKFDFDWFMFTE